MTLQARLLKEHGTIDFTAGAALVAGQVLQVAGRAGVVTGLKGFASGEKASVQVEGQFEVASASGTTFAAGVLADWDDTAKLAVATTTGDFNLGRVSRAKVSGELTVLIDLNK